METTIVYWGYIGMELYDEAHHPNKVVSFAVPLLLYITPIMENHMKTKMDN